ncbi:MAG: L-glutamate gamma-semialdehyde dehydrogenase [Candidatus Marisimplicoccus sp.]|jgi:1-pyrroline-5-carboxylate dehydrogenase|nr:MAG: L-glutamate gamma-semialdehyde dehydrogenase [Flavobacteriales bacterium]
MNNSIVNVPNPVNEPIKEYKPGSPEKESVLGTYKRLKDSKTDVKMWIGGKFIESSQTSNMSPPHDHKHILGKYYLAEKKHVELAIKSALDAKDKWANMKWEERAAIFLKAAELVAGPYRDRINAATMLAQSKTIFQAEIDAACELVDFLKFNVHSMQHIYSQQPKSDPGVWNRLGYRPLEGFVYAITPFNFTAISGNLPGSAAMMGNTVVWKPSDHQIFSAKIVIDVFKEAGLPDGVINAVYGDPEMITNTILDSKHFAGIHFTGSTSVFKGLWKKIGTNIENYNSYPRIVGETGGKDFIIAHNSADTDELSTAVIRGAFEFQGQKCSAASRVYIPKSISKDFFEKLKSEVKKIKMGSPEDFKNFMTAVIHENSFDKLVNAIEKAKVDKDAEVIIGGGYDKSKGYFIEPTVIKTSNPKYYSMETELFGPVVTIYEYDDAKWNETLKIVDETSEYALTGAVFCEDRFILSDAVDKLQNCAGNFYINDKCTGAVVGQQPFGGARGSGTNDKAGSYLNLLRWTSPRLIKETFIPAKDFRYPFMG